MDILGISCFFHDAAAALLRDGQLLAAAEEERFTRKKHDFEFPATAIEFCLRTGGIAARDLDYVVFFEKPFVKFERLLLTSLQEFPRSYPLFREAMITWLGDKLWIKQLIQKRLGVAPEKILFSEHHLSHAASAFFCSPFDEAAILTVDGVGEWTTASLGVGRGSEIRLTKEIRFPHSLGLLYSAFTAFLGFEVNDGEYKVMGMAPFGIPRYVDKVHKVVRTHRDGSFELDMDYFSFHYSTHRTFSRKFEALFGSPRRPRADFSGELTRGDQHYADIAASIQAGRSCSRWRRRCSARPACGGSAWPAGSRSTASPTGGSCARPRSTRCTFSPRRVTAEARSARRCTRTTRCSATRGDS